MRIAGFHIPNEIAAPLGATIVAIGIGIALAYAIVAIGQHMTLRPIGAENSNSPPAAAAAPADGALPLPSSNRWPGVAGRERVELSARARSRNSASETCLPAALTGALEQVRAACGPVAVLSTRRPGAHIPTGHLSLHALCQAVDFKPSDCGCAYRVLGDWPAGLSLDCKAMRHIHLSVAGLRNEGRFYHHRGNWPRIVEAP